jgi:hypothetical protein
VVSLFLLLAIRLPQTFEPVFPYAAAGASPIGGKVFKIGSLGDFSLLVPPVRVVNVAAGAGSLALELVLVFTQFQVFSLTFSFHLENYNMFLPPSHSGKRIRPEMILMILKIRQRLGIRR